MGIKYECYGGPADGQIVDVDNDKQHLDYIYIALPLRGRQPIYTEPPAGSYSRYKLATPTVKKCQWAGDYRHTEDTHE